MLLVLSVVDSLSGIIYILFDEPFDACVLNELESGRHSGSLFFYSR